MVNLDGKFSELDQKDSKVFGKSTVTLWNNIAYMVNLFVFITHNNYDGLLKLFKILQGKM